MNLKEMLIDCRMSLKDVGIKATADSLLIGAANEAKDELVQIMRQAREDFFIAQTISTVAAAASPYPSTLTLPDDFIYLKDIYCNQSGYEGIVFVAIDRADPRFRRALLDGGYYQAGNTVCYYDIGGNSQLILAPGFDTALQITVDYVKSVADMVDLDDTISEIPAEYHSYITAHMVCSALRMAASPALAAWEEHLAEKKKHVQQNIEPRQAREPKFVRGYMEEECW